MSFLATHEHRVFQLTDHPFIYFSITDFGKEFFTALKIFPSRWRLGLYGLWLIKILTFWLGNFCLSFPKPKSSYLLNNRSYTLQLHYKKGAEVNIIFRYLVSKSGVVSLLCFYICCSQFFKHEETLPVQASFSNPQRLMSFWRFALYHFWPFD